MKKLNKITEKEKRIDKNLLNIIKGLEYFIDIHSEMLLGRRNKNKKSKPRYEN